MRWHNQAGSASAVRLWFFLLAREVKPLGVDLQPLSAASKQKT